MRESTQQKFKDLIHSLTGITVPLERMVMIEARLLKRMNELGIGSFERYLDRAIGTQAERQAFIDIVTTNETYFFRTPRIWDYLASNLLSRWEASYEGDAFQAWSSASSSGEEAYSLGVLLEKQRVGRKGFEYEILGTDISRAMIELCRKASYKGHSINLFRTSNPGLFEAYMQKNIDETYTPMDEIRSRTHFHVHNIFDGLDCKRKFDLIMLRNVLIYFNEEDQKRAIEQVSKMLSPKGLLIIGESESISFIRTNLRKVEPSIFSLPA